MEKNWRKLINNVNPNFNCTIIATKKQVACFGADTLEDIEMAIESYIEESKHPRTKAKIFNKQNVLIKEISYDIPNFTKPSKRNRP